MGAQRVEDRLAEVHRLRAKVEQVQGRSLDAPALPAYPALSRLLPGGGLRPGSVYTLAPGAASVSLLLSLLAPPSQAGSWCGVVGMPDLGAEAAERLGVDLSKLVIVPGPGSRWLAVTSTVTEVLPVVAVRPPGRVSDAEASRFAARLRDRGSVLLVQGSWPQAEATLSVSDAGWSGLGQGHGYLGVREATITVASRRLSTPRRGRMLLPALGGIVEDRAPVWEERFPRVSEALPVRAVG
ncbi:hypothetical protein GCM10009808_14760 [Microbacterium sediminicola]|uniref:Protein ImuA n=2 Tax=Microbacterium sediminicola TaxID=415210 RepID=A0ABN2I477_9MICO